MKADFWGWMLRTVLSQFEIKLNHGDTVTLSYTGIISVFLCELSGSVVKKTAMQDEKTSINL